MWNERYGEPGYAYGIAPNDFLVSVASRIPRGRVLSLGEGEGRNAIYLAGLGCDVVAVDSSDVGLQKTRRRASECGVILTTIVADLRDFVIQPEQWDAIISIFCHLPPALRASVHRASVNGLKPGGVFVLEAYTPKQLDLGTGGPRDPEMLMTLDQLRRELAGLHFEHAVETERPVVEGRYHTGTASVVQVLAVK